MMDGLIDDLVWACRMFSARRFRKKLLFSRRVKHSSEFTRILDRGERVAWPDGVFHMREEDFARAREAANAPPKTT